MAKERSNSSRLMKTIFNPRVWMDFEQVKNSTKYLGDGISKLFTLEPKVRNIESFEETMARLNIDEAKIISKQKSLFRLSILMLVLAFLVFFYAAMHIYLGNFHTAGASIVIFLVMLALAFRYHFWYYQLKVRQLGCTVKEWFVCGLLGAKK